MKKAIVLVAPGFEEGETLTIVDILRRGNVECKMMGFDKVVTGAHNIEVMCDITLSLDVDDYDMVILPGGIPGATNLRDNETVIKILNKMNNGGKYVCAMCAAPIALQEAGLLKNRNYTAYVGYNKKIKDGNYLEDIVVIDGNVVTSRGPATVYAFAYKLLDILGIDSLPIKNRMVYFTAFNEEDK